MDGGNASMVDVHGVIINAGSSGVEGVWTAVTGF